jgi:2-pyrone-4,6-dicarboxylate lactonase
MQFEKTPGWLDWYAQPSKPRFKLPDGAVDTHCHVFGPGDEFPFAPERKYTPCDASKAQLFGLRDHLGFARNVIVQATCHGADNSAVVDALAAANGKARGIATVKRSVSDTELQALHASGVRGVRFNFVKRLVDFTPKDEVNRFVNFIEHHKNVWSKVSCPERLSVSGPPALGGEQQAYRDVVPFARRLVETFPDRVLWGTDWPHPNLKGHMPDDGLLVDFIPHIATTPELQQKLLVGNPMRLYWPEEAR